MSRSRCLPGASLLRNGGYDESSGFAVALRMGTVNATC